MIHSLRRCLWVTGTKSSISYRRLSFLLAVCHLLTANQNHYKTQIGSGKLQAIYSEIIKNNPSPILTCTRLCKVDLIGCAAE